MIVTLEKYVTVIDKMSIRSFPISRRDLTASLGCYMLPLGICITNGIYGPIEKILEESDVSLGRVFNCLLAMSHPSVLVFYWCSCC